MNRTEIVRMVAVEFNALRAAHCLSLMDIVRATGVDRKALQRIQSGAGNVTLATFLQTLGNMPFGIALLRRVADKLEESQRDLH